MLYSFEGEKTYFSDSGDFVLRYCSTRKLLFFKNFIADVESLMGRQSFRARAARVAIGHSSILA